MFTSYYCNLQEDEPTFERTAAVVAARVAARQRTWEQFLKFLFGLLLQRALRAILRRLWDSRILQAAVRMPRQLAAHVGTIFRVQVTLRVAQRSDIAATSFVCIHSLLCLSSCGILMNLAEVCTILIVYMSRQVAALLLTKCCEQLRWL